MSQQLDTQGEAHQALGTAVASYGQRVLSDPHTLGNLVTDLLPDLPRERSLLVTGAEAGVAAEMRQHVEEQHIDPDTAVQLVASALSERRAIDPAAGLWVASEYAQALGYQVRPYTSAVPPGRPQQVSLATPATSAMPSATEAPAIQGPGPQSWPPAGQAPQRPPGQFWQPSLPQQPWSPAGSAAQSWPPAGPPPQSWPPAGPAPGQSWPPQSSSGGPRSSWSGRKRGLVAAGTAVALLGGYLIAATFAHVPVHQVPPGRGLVPDPLAPSHAEADTARDSDPDRLTADAAGDEEAALAGQELVRAVVADWRSAVADQLEARPYTAKEQSLLDLATDTPAVPYGSTLLVAVLAARWLVCAQIGDGDMLAVRPDGSSFSPVAADDRLDGHRTTSLCQPDALASFRTGAHDLRQVPLAALLLATDGYGNAQADEPWQPSVGRDLAELALCHDRHWFEQEVPGWARRCASAEGSGDDATIALMLPGEARDAEEGG
jgi:Protein phosphatase 2C